MDLRLLPLALGLWIGAGGSLFVANLVSALAIVIWLVSLGLISYLLLAKVNLRYWEKINSKYLILGFIFGILLTGLRVEPLLVGPLSLAAKERAVVEVTGVMVNDPSRSKSVNGLDLSTRDFGYFTLRAEKVFVRGIEYKIRVPILVYFSGQENNSIFQLPPGTRLNFSGRVSNAQVTRGVAAQVASTSKIEIVSASGNYQYIAANFRSGLHKALDWANPAVAGLVPGLALGDDSQLTAQLEHDMKVSGLTHLTAVSGSNVTLLIAIVLALGRKFNFANKTNYLLAIGSLAAFVVIVRPQPSVLRASVMGVIMVLALISKSPKSPLPALTASVILLVAIDPWLSISYGFALSVFATAGLLLWAKSLLQTADQIISKRIPQWVLSGLVVTICAQLAVFPLLIALNSEISLGSLPANLISVPLAGPTMILGLIAAAFVPIYFPLAKVFAFLATIPANGIVGVATLFAKQNWLVIPWPQSFIGVLMAIGLITFLVLCKMNWTKFGDSQKTTSTTILLICLFFIWQPPNRAITNWIPSNWVVVACDVGQGDATVIKTAKNEAVVVDVGGDPDLIDSCLTELKVKRIPLLLLTHFHADHVVGLSGALRHREVGQIRVSPLAEPPLTTDFVRQVLAENNQAASILAYPEYLRIGELEIFTVWPKAKIDQTSDTPNNSSVSILIKTKVLTLLLPGDVEPIAQVEMLKIIGQAKIDVLKIPHHGSRYQSTEFALATNPKLAIISAGAQNSYGHPAPETIFLYEMVGAKVLRTDNSGSIAVAASGGNLSFNSQK